MVTQMEKGQAFSCDLTLTLKSVHLGEIQVQSHICICYAGKAAKELRERGWRNIWESWLL
jgi:hypothetical protein